MGWLGLWPRRRGGGETVIKRLSLPKSGKEEKGEVTMLANMVSLKKRFWLVGEKGGKVDGLLSGDRRYEGNRVDDIEVVGSWWRNGFV